MYFWTHSKIILKILLWLKFSQVFWETDQPGRSDRTANVPSLSQCCGRPREDPHWPPGEDYGRCCAFFWRHQGRAASDPRLGSLYWTKWMVGNLESYLIFAEQFFWGYEEFTWKLTTLMDTYSFILSSWCTACSITLHLSDLSPCSALAGQFAYRQFAFGQCANRTVCLRIVCLPDSVPARHYAYGQCAWRIFCNARNHFLYL